MNYKIVSLHPVEALLEISLDVDGAKYLVIYGKHPNGGFCCIPNWNIACEMGEPDDTAYNAAALMHSRMAKYNANAIADAICAVATMKAESGGVRDGAEAI